MCHYKREQKTHPKNKGKKKEKKKPESAVNNCSGRSC